MTQNLPLIHIQTNSNHPFSFPFERDSFIHSTLQYLQIHEGHFEFTFTTDTHITKLHSEYFNKDSTTDVITFNLGSNSVPDGDIYICIDEAKRQASHLNHSLEFELKTLIIHGILHLIGFVDDDPSSKKEMFQKI